jgi:hypothetical protein
MQAIEVFDPGHTQGGDGSPAGGETVSDLIRKVLQEIQEGEAALPRSLLENLSVALVMLDGGRGQAGSRLVHYRGDRPFFPADLVSLFFLAGVILQIKAGVLAEDKNVERDILRTIRGGNADAANLLLDRITGTLSGPELPEANLEVFARRRGRLDELLKEIGIPGTRCVQKIWDRPPYGRDAQFLGEDQSRENQVTAVATAFLLTKLALGQVGGEDSSRQFLDLIRLDLSGFSGQRRIPRLASGLPAGSQAFGWCTVTHRVHHEAVIVELPRGQRYAMAFLSYLGGKHQEVPEAIGRGVARSFLG